MIEKQQGMEVLGVDLSPSVSVKDRFIVRPHVMLNACLSLVGRITRSDHEANSSSSTQAGSREVKVRTLAVVRMCGEPLA